MNINFKNKKNSLKSILFSGLLTFGFGLICDVNATPKTWPPSKEKSQEVKKYMEQYFPKTYKFLKKCSNLKTEPISTQKFLASLSKKIPDTESIDTTISECFENLYQQKKQDDWGKIGLYLKLSLYLWRLDKIDQINTVLDIKNSLEFADKLSHLSKNNSIFTDLHGLSFLEDQLPYIYAITNGTSIELNEIKEIKNTNWFDVYNYIKREKKPIKTIEDLNNVIETVKKMQNYAPYKDYDQLLWSYQKK